MGFGRSWLSREIVAFGLFALLASAYVAAACSSFIGMDMLAAQESRLGSIAGIMGATLSSALGSMLGAPRILQALAEQKTVPFSLER